MNYADDKKNNNTHRINWNEENDLQNSPRAELPPMNIFSSSFSIHSTNRGLSLGQVGFFSFGSSLLWLCRCHIWWICLFELFCLRDRTNSYSVLFLSTLVVHRLEQILIQINHISVDSTSQLSFIIAETRRLFLPPSRYIYTKRQGWKNTSRNTETKIPRNFQRELS